MDADGVKVTHTPGVRSGVWMLVTAVALVCVALLVLVRPLFESGDKPVRPIPPPQAAKPRPAAPPMKLAGARLQPLEGREPDKPPPEALAAAEQERADRLKQYGDAVATAVAEDARTRDSDEPRGIELFPPPGTNPPKSGILVPDDFELPPGYIRHFQVTDDGQQLPAILMFHPDFQLVDAEGQPLPMPDDRIVPAEMAPPGLEIHMLDVPDTQVPLVEIPEDGEQDANP